MDLDTTLLRAFVAVADRAHFRRAAEDLYLSQQALSQRVARLESALGVRLFDRDRRSVSLTAAGRGLLPAAREILDRLDEAIAATSGVRGLTVDVLDDNLSMLPAVRSIRDSVAGLSLSAVYRRSATTAADGLRSGAADVAFGRPGPMGHPVPDDLRGQDVFAEAIDLLVPVGHRLAGETALTMAELRGLQVWFPTTGAPQEWIDLLADLTREFSLQVSTRGSTFGYAAWMSAIADGTANPSLLGAAMPVPAGVDVVRVPIRQPAPVFWWWAIWRRKLPTALVRRLVDQVGAQLALPDGPKVSATGLDRGDVWVPPADVPFAR